MKHQVLLPVIFLSNDDPGNMAENVPHTHKYMIETLQISVSPEPLHRFNETCYVSFGTSAYNSLFKC